MGGSQDFAQMVDILYMVESTQFSTFNLQTKEFVSNWNEITIPQRVSDRSCLVVTSDHLIITGGYASSPWRSISDVQTYNLNTAIWDNILPNLPSERSSHTCNYVPDTGKLYVIGFGDILKIKVYPSENYVPMWFSISGTLKYAGSIRSVFYEGWIYVIGEEDSTDVYMINTGTDEVSKAYDKELPYEIFTPGVIIADDILYCFGGESEDETIDTWIKFELSSTPWILENIGYVIAVFLFLCCLCCVVYALRKRAINKLDKEEDDKETGTNNQNIQMGAQQRALQRAQQRAQQEWRQKQKIQKVSPYNPEITTAGMVTKNKKNKYDPVSNVQPSAPPNHFDDDNQFQSEGQMKTNGDEPNRKLPNQPVQYYQPYNQQYAAKKKKNKTQIGFFNFGKNKKQKKIKKIVMMNLIQIICGNKMVCIGIMVRFMDKILDIIINSKINLNMRMITIMIKIDNIMDFM